MKRFLLRRILQGLLIIWGIVTVLFLIFNLLGDPLAVMAGEKSDEATRNAIAKAYHLDQPLGIQYLLYLNDLSPIGIIQSSDPDLEQQHYLTVIPGATKSLTIKWPYFRRSFATGDSVAAMILSRLPGTFILAFAAMIFATLLGTGLGFLSALYKDRIADRAITFFTLLGISAPSFLVAVILIRIFAVDLGGYTHLNVSGYMVEEEIFGDGYYLVLKNLFLPALALGIRPLAVITQLTRSSMIEVMSMDYVRTARAKGLSEKVVLFRHAFRNALTPVVTSVSGWLASLLAGAFFVEAVFDWHGLGKLTVDALGTNDYPLIIGCCIVMGVIFVCINILVDLLYVKLDPRVKLTA
jgi:peptide/nickel transport system permease protein